MAKAKTSKNPKKSGVKLLKEYDPFSSRELKDPEVVIDALMDCIRGGDLETFREVLVAHLMTMNKSALSKRTGIARRTLYDLMDTKRKFNPELSTISAIIRAIAA